MKGLSEFDETQQGGSDAEESATLRWLTRREVSQALVQERALQHQQAKQRRAQAKVTFVV